MTKVSSFHKEGVKGFLHQPPGVVSDGLVLTHGAGGNCETPLLATTAAAFAAAGVCVLRCDLPFRQQQPRGAPHPSSAATDRAALKAAVLALREILPGRIFMGGQSYGGRQGSILAAEEPGLADALLLMSYPLHPPGRPEQLRTAHFPSLRTPALFVHGTRDPFGSLDEMRAAVELVPARTVLVEIAGAGHDLARGKFDVARLVVEPFAALVRDLTGVPAKA